MVYKAYVGTYTSGESKGIYTFSYNEKEIYDVNLFAEVKNPKYLCFVNDYIAAVCDFENSSGLVIYDADANIVAALAYEKSTSCYLCYENNYIYTVNYHEGRLSIIEFKNNNLKLIKIVDIREKAGSHQVLVYKDKILVPCLFLDEIIIINKDTLEIENSIKFEKNSGPRHGIFSDDKKFLYVVGELSNRLYAVDMESLSVVNKIDLLENGESFVKDSAAIRKQGEYLYISTRTKDVISVIKYNKDILQRIQVKACYGKHPRDFIIVKSGLSNNLIVANRLSNKISLINIKDNLLGDEVSAINIPEAISIIIKEKNDE